MYDRYPKAFSMILYDFLQYSLGFLIEIVNSIELTVLRRCLGNLNIFTMRLLELTDQFAAKMKGFHGNGRY